MRWLPPLVLHGAHRADAATLQRHEDVFAARLASHPDWPELAEGVERLDCPVPADARPAD